MTDTEPCPCGKRMILVRTGEVQISPPQWTREWRCFGCDFRMIGPVERVDIISTDHLRWLEANSHYG